MTPIARWLGPDALSERERAALRKRCWRELRIIVITPTDIADEELRKRLVAEADRLFGTQASEVRS